MRKEKFVVLDSKNQLVEYCDSYYEANLVRKKGEHWDWSIVSYYNAYPTGITTEKQRNAVGFIEKILDVKFAGNLYDWRDVSPFLTDYLEIAKQTYTELKCEFETDRGY